MSVCKFATKILKGKKINFVLVNLSQNNAGSRKEKAAKQGEERKNCKIGV